MIARFPFKAGPRGRRAVAALAGLAALTTGACDSHAPAVDGTSTALPEPVPDGSLMTGAEAPSPEELRARVEAAVGAILADKGRALYSNIRSGSAGAICGEVAVGHPDMASEGAKPFVVLPQGVAQVSATSQLDLGNPDDPFPDLYLQWCASVEELKRLEPELAKASAARAAAGEPSASELDPIAGLEDSADPAGDLPAIDPEPREPANRPATDEGRVDVGKLGNALRRKRVAGRSD